MADNTPIIDGLSATEMVASDELATQNGVDVSGASPRVKAQRVKVGYGSDGDMTDVDLTHGMPVQVPGSVTVGTAPAASRLTDSISSAAAVDAIMNGIVAVTPQFQTITTSASGATTLVTGTAAKRIVVLSYVLVANGAVNAKFQSHTGPTDLTGLLYFAQNGGVSAAFCPVGHFKTNSGEALDINLSGAIAVGGHLVYVVI